MWRIEFDGDQALYVKAETITEAIATAQNQAWLATGKWITVVKAEKQKGEPA